ncbi:MAG: hypothetical protein EXR60_02040 [Dehalococcoidia bacterium]|nr:hypothetical protein [Dehalococcoidia bacterium]
MEEVSMGFLGSKWSRLAVVAGALALMVTSVGAVAAAGPGERGPGPGRPGFGGPPGPRGGPGERGENDGVRNLNAILAGLERSFNVEQKLIEQANKRLSPEAQAKLLQALELAKQAGALEKLTLEPLAKEEREKSAEVRGGITALDAAAKKVTIAKRGDDDKAVTVVVTEDTKLMKDGKPATFDQLVVGDMAAAVYERESGVARLLNVHTERPDVERREGRPRPGAGPQRGPGRGGPGGDHRPGGDEDTSRPQREN